MSTIAYTSQPVSQLACMRSQQLIPLWTFLGHICMCHMASRSGTVAAKAAQINGSTERICIAFPPKLCRTSDGHMCTCHHRPNQAATPQKSLFSQQNQNKTLSNQELFSLNDSRRSRWMGIPMSAITSRPMMYLPAEVERNLPDGLGKPQHLL